MDDGLFEIRMNRTTERHIAIRDRNGGVTGGGRHIRAFIITKLGWPSNDHLFSRCQAHIKGFGGLEHDQDQ